MQKPLPGEEIETPLYLILRGNNSISFVAPDGAWYTTTGWRDDQSPIVELLCQVARDIQAASDIGWGVFDASE